MYFFDEKSFCLFAQKKKAYRFFANGGELKEGGCVFQFKRGESVFFKIAQLQYPGKAEAAFCKFGFTVLHERPVAYSFAVRELSLLPEINQSR